MAKDKEKDVKTNAMRILDTLGVPYEVITYTCDEFTDGVHLAEQLLEGLLRSLDSLRSRPSRRWSPRERAAAISRL